ncbi:two-component system sensor histidine kinase NtrB [Sphingobium boeckii]|uniref:histidine kinase n=1 Tax=Sphingobium boeckii TaxID=1082345 RepID=A0A7W9AKM8_9SPHN|nr:ATP-binding protein [Sphingobium boeckii]MBB5687298.1 two-component system nitrogen regulation sensor histidine kinase GlnL [Sphingobium boeckii]
MALPGSGLIRLGRRAAATPDVRIPAFAELFAVLPTPFMVVDPAGMVAEANIASETLLNVGRTAIIGRMIEDMIGHPLTSMRNDAPFAAYDLEIVLPDGRHRRVDLMAAPLPDHQGWRSITLHSRVPAHIVGRRAEREGGKMTAIGAAAMLAHEIKNPLSGIRGAAQLLESSVDEGARDLTVLIRDEVDRVTKLIDRMEGFTDTRSLDLKPQNIHSILSHACEVARQGFARDIRIRESYDPSLPEVMGHRDSLVQVIINLLKNAAEAIGDRDDARIVLTTAYRHGVSFVKQNGFGKLSLPIEVCVIDNGPGAPPEIGEHLFDPFVTSKRTGSGLGLALVDKLITDQGGIVEYAREGRPALTVFRLLLPRAR